METERRKDEGTEKKTKVDKWRKSKAEGKRNFITVPLNLRIAKSLDSPYRDFSSALGRTQWTCRKIYNETVLDVTKAIYSGDKIDVYNAFYHGYGKDLITPIKLGLLAKIRSSLGKATKIKAIRNLSSNPPYAGKNFTVTYYRQGGFKFEKLDNGEYIINLPMQGLDKFSLVKGKPTHQRVLLSTKTRRVRTTWIADDTYDSNIRKTLEGKHQAQFIEVKKKGNNWFVFLMARVPRVTRDFDESEAVRIGIDMGISTVFNIAFDNSPARFSLPQRAPSLVQFETDSSKRRFSIIRSKVAMRNGHGRKNKLQPLNDETNRIIERRKKIMELVVRETIDKILRHVGNKPFIVCLETLGRLTENRPRCLFQANKNFPYKRLQDMLARKVEEEGGRIEWVKSEYTSQRCSKCGLINTYYNYDFRKDGKNREKGKDPLFRCKECGYGDNETVTGDYNASRNLLTPDIDKLISKQLKAQGIKKEKEEDEKDETSTTYH